MQSIADVKNERHDGERGAHCCENTGYTDACIIPAIVRFLLLLEGEGNPVGDEVAKHGSYNSCGD